MGGKTRNIAIQLVFQQCQPRPQGFSLKKWVGRPTHFSREKPWERGCSNVAKRVARFLLRVLPLQWRMQTFKLKGGPSGYSDPEIRGDGEGLQKNF